MVSGVAAMIFAASGDIGAETLKGIIVDNADQIADQTVGGRRLHGRMPVILETSQEYVWLGTKAALPELLNMLGSAPSQDLKAYEVSPLVNRGTVDTPEIIKRAA
jgi:SOS response associated peptidase (SRAP)